MTIFIRRAGQDTFSQLASLLFGPKWHRLTKGLSLKNKIGLRPGICYAKGLKLVLALKKDMEFPW